MKKLLFFCFIFLISSCGVFAKDVKFVQIDDLRFSPYSESSVEKFQNIINDINKEREVSFVIFTGNNIAKSDLTYLEAFLKKAKKLKAPYYVALGHKDLNKQKGLSKTNYTEIVRRYTYKNIKPNYAFSKNKVRFIVVDGAKEFIATPFGYYRKDAIDFVDGELTKNSKNNAVILQHFPIYAPSKSEAYQIYRVEEYFEMLKKHDNLKAVVSGFGINSETDVDGVKHITTASFPQYRIIEIIDCTASNPTIWSTLK